jgi:hypothetical protein
MSAGLHLGARERGSGPVVALLPIPELRRGLPTLPVCRCAQPPADFGRLIAAGTEKLRKVVKFADIKA